MSKIVKLIFGILYFITIMTIPAGIIHIIINSNMSQILMTVAIMTIGIFSGRGLYRFSEYASDRYEDDINRIFVLVSIFYILITLLALTILNLI